MNPVMAAITRGDVADYVSAFFYVYSLLILAYIVLSLIYAFARVPYMLWLNRIFDWLRDISEPWLGLFRRFIPSFGAFDLSPLVALIALSIIGGIVVRIIRG
jgi:YggT family protein